MGGTILGLPTEGPQDVPDDRRARAARLPFRLTPMAAVITAATVLALALRVYQLARPGHLLGVGEYDEGPDFGSAVLLVHGILPYRDYVLVHPPGITLLMAPVALLSRVAGTSWAIGAARILTALASTGAVVLGGLIVRHRGLLAVAVACGLIAIYPGSVQAAHVVLLEPWLVLLCLVGTMLAFDGDSPVTGGRLAWSGVAFGFAGAVKVWAVIPAAVVLVILLASRRGAVRYLAGLAAGFVIPVLPFAALAPGRFYDDVVKAQLVRTGARTSLSYRIDQLLGLGWLPRATLLAELAAVIMIVVPIALFSAWVAARSKPPALEWFAVATAGLVAVAFFVPDDFYYHYAAFFGPFLALALALIAARFIRRPQRRLVRRVAVGAAVLAVVVLPVAVPGAESFPEPTYTSAIDALRQVIPPGSCVMSDQASMLISADRLVSSVPGCVPLIDGFGSSYALDGRAASASGSNPAVAGLWRRAFKAAQFILLTTYSPRRIAWSPALRAYLRANFVHLSGPWPELRLYERRSG